MGDDRVEEIDERVVPLDIDEEIGVCEAENDTCLRLLQENRVNIDSRLSVDQRDDQVESLVRRRQSVRRCTLPYSCRR